MSLSNSSEGIQLSDIRIGVDLGGTKIEALALNDDGTVALRHRIATPRDDYPATLEAIADLVTSIEKKLKRSGKVGIGMPGAISPHTGLVKNANSTWLNGQPFTEDMERLLGRPLRFENDANCFALSEALIGAGKGARVVFGVILGTGVGGGIVVDGKIWRGGNAIAGEWGHNPLPAPHGDERPGPNCYCGRRGCIETFVSGPGMARDYQAVAGRQLDPPAILKAAEAGEPEAVASLKRYEDRLARGLASVINLLDPDVIVLGGGMSNLDRLYANVPKLWEGHVFSDKVDTRLVRAAHGDSSGVLGAVRLWEL
jgi:fructokinase